MAIFGRVFAFQHIGGAAFQVPADPSNQMHKFDFAVEALLDKAANDR